MIGIGDTLIRLGMGICCCFYRFIVAENECNLYQRLFHDELHSQMNHYINNSNITYNDI
jgi:hypothetical protein